MRETMNTIRKYAENHTVREIADHFGKNPNTVRSYLVKHNIPYKRERVKITKEVEMDILAYLGSHTLEEASLHFGISARAIGVISVEHGLSARRGCSVTNDIERCQNCPFPDCIAWSAVIMRQMTKEEKDVLRSVTKTNKQAREEESETDE